MDETDKFEYDLESVIRWHRLRIDKRSDSYSEMDKWCREQFGNSTAFRFGKSFFFESAEDKVSFIMRWL